MEVGMIDQLLFCKLQFHTPESAPDVQFCLQISSDFSWKVFFCGKELQRECSILQDARLHLTAADNVVCVIDRVSNSRPCLGNSDETYMALLPSRKGVFHDHTGMCKCAYMFLCYNMCTTIDNRDA